MTAHQLAFMPAHVIRNFLFDIAQQCAAGDYRIPCGSVPEATKLRNRLNKIRATDRKQAQRDYAAAGATLDRSRGESPMDWLVFRTEGQDVVVTKSPTTKADLYGMAGIGHLLTPGDKAEDEIEKRRQVELALPPLRTDGGDEPAGIGRYDTAPGLDGKDVF